MEWFRMYAEFASDPKVQSMSEAMQRRLMMLFCLRCSNTLVTLHDDEIAFALRIDEHELAETKVLFLRKGFIKDAWELTNWEKRQYASDSSAARVAKHRAKQKEQVKQACNVTVTVQNRVDTEQIQNRIEEASTAQAPLSPLSPTAVDLSVAMRKAGVATQPADPRLIALAAQGVGPETVTAACDEARSSKPGAKISAGYVFAIVERWAGDAKGLRAAGATAPNARASPGYQTAIEKSRDIANALTGRARNANDHRTIDITPA